MNYKAQFPLQESQKAWRDSQKFKPYYARAKNPSTWRTGAGAPIEHTGPGSISRPSTWRADAWRTYGPRKTHDIDVGVVPRGGWSGIPRYNPRPVRPPARPGRPTYDGWLLRPKPERPTYDGIWNGRPPERPGGWYGRPPERPGIWNGRPKPKPGMSYEDYFSGGGKPTPPPNPGYVDYGPRPIHPGPNPMHSATHDADYKDWKEEYYAANPEKRWEKVDRSNYLSGVRERGDSFKEFQEKRRQETEDYYASKPQYRGEMMEEWKGNRPEWMTQEHTDAHWQGTRDRWFEGLEPEDPRRKAWETKKRQEHSLWSQQMREWYNNYNRPYWHRGPSRNVKYRT